MSKKTKPSIKPAAPAKPRARPAAKKPPTAVTAVAAKPAPPTKAKAKTPPKAIAAPRPAFTRDDIALRAYFIAEKRRRHGLPGDESHDWIEAERQLAAESKPAKKAAPRKTMAK